jgi:hypothetical protein
MLSLSQIISETGYEVRFRRILSFSRLTNVVAYSRSRQVALSSVVRLQLG